MKKWLSTLLLLFVVCFSVAQKQNSSQLPTHQKKMDALLSFNKTLKDENIDINLISEYQSQVNDFIKSKIIPEKDSLFKSVLYHKLGSKWYYPKWKLTNEQKDLISAIDAIKKSLRIKKELNLVDCSINQLLFNLGKMGQLNSDYEQSIKNYIEVINNGNRFCSKKKGKGFGDNKIYFSTQSLAFIYTSFGDSYKAIKYLEDFLYKYDKQISEETRLKVLIELANAFSVMSFIDFSNEIKGNLIKANKVLKNNNFNDQLFYRSQINTIEGNRLELKKEYNKAILLHKKVINDLYEINNEDSLNISFAYNSLGLSQLKIKDYKNSYSNLKKAISYNLYYTAPYNNLGDYYVDHNDFKQALVNYQKAIVYSYNKNVQIEYTNLPTISEIEVSNEKISLLNHIVTKADGWIKFYEYEGNKNHLKQALKTFKLADQLIDIIRFQSKEYQSKLFWRKQGASLYLKAVKVCYLLGKPEEAFYFMERNKALLLLADITNEKAKEITNFPSEISEKEFLLKNAIYLAENDVYENKLATKDTLKVYKDRLYFKKALYEKFVDSLEQVFPQYAKFKKKVEVVNLKSLREIYISEHKHTLHYLLNEEVGYGLLTTTDEQLLFDLEVSKGLINDVESLSKQLSGEKIEFKNFAHVSHSVFNALIPDFVYTKIKGKNVTVVSDHILQKLPFDVLISDKTNTRYLIEDTEISYVYSMSHLDQNTSKEKKYSKEYVGFASEKFNNQFTDLLYNKDEVKGASELFDGDTFFDQKAIKSNFLNSTGDYKIVHVSTHAGIKDNTPYIAFKDSLVNINEVYASKINPELLVLSACNTSNGEIKAGEGVMSLARGFFYSGTKSIVSSLWSINDKSSNYIINEFYKNLKKEQLKSTALRNAKLSYLNKNNENKLSPNLWGALVLIGNNEPIQSVSFLEAYKFYLLIFGVMLFFGFFFKKRIASFFN